MGFKNILAGICLLIGLTIFAQPKPSAIADKVEILIGEQIKLKLSASFTTDDFNAFMQCKIILMNELTLTVMNPVTETF